MEAELAEQIRLKHIVMQERDMIKQSAQKLANDLRQLQLELAKEQDARRQMELAAKREAERADHLSSERREARAALAGARLAMAEIQQRIQKWMDDYHGV